MNRLGAPFALTAFLVLLASIVSIYSLNRVIHDREFRRELALLGSVAAIQQQHLYAVISDATYFDETSSVSFNS